jgi:pilus assembly protein CpaC
MRENNLLRVLAEPTLTTTSGQEASFLAGGEIPIPVPQTGGGANGGYVITIDYKKFGVQLKFVPIVLGDGRIRLKVTPEVSDLDNTHSITNGGFQIPAFTSRITSTTVELNEGQTLSLAGLLNTRVSTDTQVTPLLGDLPILGTLFRSVRYSRQETELVVLVTPHLVSGMNPAQVPSLPGEHWRYPTESELFWHRDLGGPAPETGRTPSAMPPPQFHGTYGFAPAARPVMASTK